MPQRVTFNGSTIIRPGAASKVDVSAFENVDLSGSGIVAVIGEAEDGVPHTWTASRNAGIVQRTFGRGDLVEAAQILCDPGNDPAIATGAQQIWNYRINAATQASLTKSPHIFNSRTYGLVANNVAMALAAGTTTIGRIVTIDGLDLNGVPVVEVSGSLGETAKIAIAYVGAGSACTLTVTATGLTSSVTGGPGSENLAVVFADYRSLQEIVAYIDGLAAYTCTSLVTNVGAFDPTYLDALSAVPIKARTGAAASTAAGATITGAIRLTGLTGMLATDVGQYLTISGGASAGNNGTFKIAAYVSATSVDIYNTAGVVPDANNGSVAWTTTSYYVYATNWDLLDWVNKNSTLVESSTTSYTKGIAGPIATFSRVGLTGGTRGTSATSDWIAALAELENIRVNHVILLASTDATASQGSFAIDSLVAALTAHCKKMTGTAGKSERQGWMGVSKTKSAFITLLQAQNSKDLCLSAQKLLRLKVATNAIEYLPEWSFACAAAGMRAGAQIQEPLTHKIVNAQGVTQDASWSDQDTPDVEDLLLAGAFLATMVQGVGVRIEKGQTTYTGSDNDAFAQESIVNIWKLYTYDLRNAVERRIIGHAGDLELVQSLFGVVDSVSLGYEKRKALSKGTDPTTGEEVASWRGVTVSLNGGVVDVGVTISPTASVDYARITEYLVPVSITA